MEAMSYGDAVSNIARGNARLLAGLGHGERILSRAWDPRVSKDVRSLHAQRLDDQTAIVYHYWGFSDLEDLILAFPGRTAVYYHNITPSRYFTPGSPGYDQTMQGQAQLRRMANAFDIAVAPSTHNLSEFARLLDAPRPTLCVPPIVDPQEVAQRPVDARLLNQLKRLDGVKFLFLGRISPNKRQDRVMRMFDYYYREINRHAHLFLVGNNLHTPAYFRELDALRNTLESGDNIVFTGHVTDEETAAYYRAADVFVSASEHEGFCVPIAEAMAHDIPVVAFAAAAVPETLGGSGLLVHEWDDVPVAELINVVLKDLDLRRTVIEGQRRALGRCSIPSVRERLGALVAYLAGGEESPFLVYRDRVNS